MKKIIALLVVLVPVLFLSTVTAYGKDDGSVFSEGTDVVISFKEGDVTPPTPPKGDPIVPPKVIPKRPLLPQTGEMVRSILFLLSGAAILIVALILILSKKVYKLKIVR